MEQLYEVQEKYCLCKLRGSKRDGLYHKKIDNKYLISLIEEIGKNSDRSVVYKNESEYARGIRTISYHLKKKKGYEDLSIKMVRRVVKPNYKRKKVYKFPKQLADILIGIKQIVHAKPNVHDFCMRNACNKCKEKGYTSIECKEHLIGDLYEIIFRLFPTIDRETEAYSIIGKVLAFTDGCKYNGKS